MLAALLLLFLQQSPAAPPDSGAARTLATLLVRGRASLGRQPFDTTRAIMLRAERAAIALPDSLSIVETRAYLAWIASRQQPLGNALAILREAEAAVPAGNDSARAAVLCVRGPIMLFAGQPGAPGVMQEGLASAKASGSAFILARCYQLALNVAVAVGASGVTVEAYADSAAALDRQINDRWELAVTEFMRGFGRLNRSDPAGALRAFRVARHEAEASDNRFAMAWIHRFRGDIYAWAGDLVTAVAEYRAADSTMAWLGDHFGRGGLDRMAGGLLIELGRFEEAEALLTRGLIASERGGVLEGSFWNRIYLSALDLRRGRWADAYSGTEAALRWGRAHGFTTWYSSIEIAQGVAALRMGNLPRAETHLRTVLAHKESSALDHYVARSRLAEVAVRRSDLATGLAEVLQATDEIERVRAGLDDEGLRRLVYQMHDAHHEPDMGLATVIAALASGGHADAAVRLAERRRARTLQDRLALARTLLEAGSRAPPRPTLPPDSAPLAPADSVTAVVAFVTGRGGQPSTAFVAAAGTVRAVQVAPFDSLLPQVELFTDLLSQGGNAVPAGARLRTALLDPVLGLLPATVNRLVLVPDDGLYLLPFEALVLPDGRLLSERFAVSLAPSMAAARDGGPGSAGRAVLALGDPALEPAGADSLPERDAPHRMGLPRLPFAATEARTAVGYGRGSELRLRAEASESFVKQAVLDRYAVLHFAAHAVADPGSVARTALVLAPGGGEDGLLHPGEISRLQLGGSVVILSACRTAAGNSGARVRRSSRLKQRV